MTKKILGTLAAVALGVLAFGLVRAATFPLTGYIANETGLTYNNTYSVDIVANAINQMSAQAVYSSATFSNATFGDGSESTGSVTVVTPSALSTATATDRITVVSTNGLTGATLQIASKILQEGVDWKRQATASGTASNLRSAINSQVPGVTASAVGAIIYTTATVYGTLPNSYILSSSTPTALSVLTPTFKGGQDNAILAIGGQQLRQGIDWHVGTTSATAATSIASAINGNALLSLYITAIANSPTNGIIALTSKFTGLNANFALQSSTPAALAPLHPSMIGGVNSAYALGSGVINLPSHGLTLALPVLYSGTPVIGGLVSQTTYYAIPVDANSIKLGATSSGAVAGNFITITSSNSQTTAHVYTLAPLAIAGTPSFKWQASNDNSNWIDLAVSSVTLSSYNNPPATTGWDFGVINYHYVRVNVVAPTQGGILFRVNVTAKN